MGRGTDRYSSNIRMRQNISHANAHVLFTIQALINKTMRTSKSGMKYFAYYTNSGLFKKMDHLACFSGAFLIYSSVVLFVPSTHAHAHTHACTHARTHNTHTHTYTHARTHTHTHTHTHLAKGLGYYLMGLSLTVPHGNGVGLFIT